MKPKKNHKNWYMAMTHFLTAGLFFPFALSMLMPLFLEESHFFSLPPLLFYGILLIIFVLGIWIGNIIVIRYMNKNYIVNDKKAIVKFSTIYFAILVILSTGLVNKNLLFDIVVGIIEIILFYMISKKYIWKIQTEINPN